MTYCVSKNCTEQAVVGSSACTLHRDAFLCDIEDCNSPRRGQSNYCASCFEARGAPNEFESVALRSARGAKASLADANLERAEDDCRKEAIERASYVDEMQKQIETIGALSQKVKSDGGSTSYYELALTDRMVDDIQSQVSKGETATLQTGDVIELLVGNDFDAGNVIKALRRIFESKKGKGKEGVEQTYDIKKCHYFIDEVEKKL